MVINKLQKDKTPKGSKRSSKWPKVRQEHLAEHPKCVVCGSKEKVEVHHIQPFHLDPSLELNPSNFISLCEDKKNGLNCHLLVGHLGSFKSYNVNVVKDAAAWNNKIRTRPKE